ncbi:Fatty aldehyde dehydrogenaselike, partial [Caligus rogercresseyi]
LTLTPLVGAIAAGNCALLKPSELSNAVSLALKDILPQYIDETCFKIVLGGVPETQALLRVRFDYIFFTGSTGVGRVIAAAAAKHLTPCTLELGGKSPVYVHDDLSESKRRTVVKRILWGKMANAGQTCVAPDYLLVHKSAKNQLTGLIKDVYNEFYNDKQNEFK